MKSKNDLILFGVMMLIFVFAFYVVKGFIDFGIAITEDDFKVWQRVEPPSKHLNLFTENGSVDFKFAYQDGHNRLSPVSYILQDSVNTILLFDFESEKNLSELIEIDGLRTTSKSYGTKSLFHEFPMGRNKNFEYWDAKIDSTYLNKINIIHDCKIDTQFTLDNLLYMEGELGTVEIKFNGEEKAAILFEKLSNIFPRKEKLSLAILKQNKDLFLIIMESKYTKEKKNELPLYNLIKKPEIDWQYVE